MTSVYNMFSDMAKADLVTKSSELAGKIIDKYAEDLENVQLDASDLKKVAMATLMGTVQNINL